MSVGAVAWAFEQTLPPNEKVVLLALADCENGQSLACMPGQDYLAEKASMSVRTVQRMLISLEEKGMIRRTRRAREGGQRTSDSYTLALRDNLSGGRDNTTTVSGGNTTTVSGTEEPEEVTGSTPPTPSDPSFDEQFDEVWSHWPNKNGKAVAKKKWRAAAAIYRKTPMFTEGEGQSLADVVRKFGKAYRQTTPPRFIPMLASWLNQERWTDPLPVDRTRGSYNPEPLAQTPIDDSPYDATGALNIPRGMKAEYDDDGRFTRFVPLGE